MKNNINLESSSIEPINCRLCCANSRFIFEKTLLNRHKVKFYLCENCNSLQTEFPWWLNEAYDLDDIALDIGICQRTSQLVLETSCLLSLIGYPKDRIFIDFGGGNGLFARMMRDRGYNFHCFDAYQKAFYVPQFCTNDFGAAHANIITAFEVFEHFSEPAKEIKILMEKNADMVIFTTEFYRGQDLNWWYLAPEGGQHVFFYGNKAMEIIERSYNYRLFDIGFLKVFVKLSFIDMAQRQNIILSDHFHKMKDRSYFMNNAIRLFVEHQANPYQFVQADYQKILSDK